MEHSAIFRFHGTLKDFLPPARRTTKIHYCFNGSPAVKDAFEALGVPHPEVGALSVNGLPVPFLHPLHSGDEVDVLPFVSGQLADIPGRFVLDVHLGRLARLMRLLGLDAVYETGYHDREIAGIADMENRIVLTRDVGLLKHKAIQWGYWLRSQIGDEQLKEVVQHFGLKHFLPFSRCIACNGLIAPVPKEAVKEKIPDGTARYFDEFYQCASCGRVYWKGSHYERMAKFVCSFRFVVARNSV